jgi:hypothetical protein
MVAVNGSLQRDFARLFAQNFWKKLYEYFNRSFQCVKQNPELFLMRKLSRFEIVRDWVHHFKRASNQSYRISSENSAIFPDLDVDEIVASITNNGYYSNFQLPPAILKEFLNYVDSTPCYGNRDSNQKFYYAEKSKIEARLGKPFRFSSYAIDQSCLPVLQLANDPAILAIAAQFLGTDPVYIASELLWSFSVPATQLEQLKAAQVFHYDLDDYRSIKFFFYLTDVDELNGPHVALQGTHKNKKFLHQLLGQRCASIADEKLIENYGAERIKVFCGKAGFGFVEDPCCFHKGCLPAQGERLLLQLEYATKDYGNLRGTCYL